MRCAGSSEIGLPVFADTKFHDIPNTVAGAARAIAMLGVAMFNVHASGGEAMMRAAAEADRRHPSAPAVDRGDGADQPRRRGARIGRPARPGGGAGERLAALAKASGLDGVVCSAHEIASVRKACGPDFLTVVPGIRPAGSDVGRSAPGDDAVGGPRRRGRHPGRSAGRSRPRRTPPRRPAPSPKSLAITRA